MCAGVCVNICAGVHTYVCVHAVVCVCVCVHLYARMYVCVCKYACVCVCEGAYPPCEFCHVLLLPHASISYQGVFVGGLIGQTDGLVEHNASMKIENLGSSIEAAHHLPNQIQVQDQVCGGGEEQSRSWSAREERILKE